MNMGYIKYGSHTVYDIQYHVVRTTKYRYKVLQGRVAERLRILIRQGCEARNKQRRRNIQNKRVSFGHELQFALTRGLFSTLQCN